MLAPNMATMLAVLTTDAAVDGDVLQRVLQAGVDKSFNLMMTDGCTSTNDTVILLASGLAGPGPRSDLADAVAEACFSLAAQMAGDAEGATKVVRVVVTGAASDAEALTGARAIARERAVQVLVVRRGPLLGAHRQRAGRRRHRLRGRSLSVSYGGTTVAAGGITVDHDAAAVKAHMANRHIEVAADLGLGDGRGLRAHQRPDARLHRREHEDVVTATARPAAGPSEKAAVLVEALPYIRRFAGRTVVVKYGGNAISGPDDLALFAEDIVLMRTVGMRPVVVHGGGPQISDLMGRLGKVPEFRDGLRVTDAETVDIARMVLRGQVNPQVVGAINMHGPLAVGMSGEDAGMLEATARDPELGFVGDVDAREPCHPAAPAQRGAHPGRGHRRPPTRRGRRTTSTPTRWPARSPRRWARRSSST